MEDFRPLRTALCVYDGLRLAFLVGVFVLLQPEGEMPFPWLAAIAPGAMFLLMTVFWLLDLGRYGVYFPLYLAGKGLSVITAMFWFFLQKGNMIEGLFFQTHSMAFLLIVPGLVFFLILGDILSAWLVTKMMRSTDAYNSDSKR